jgi:dTDP-4-dehydrorhamnose reductase
MRGRLRIVVTGTEGQVARALTERTLTERACGKDLEVITLGRPGLDLARPETVASAISAARPDIVVNAAAYTAVDQAESEPDQAFAVNARGAGAVAAAARAAGVPIVQISTDYVFDGALDRPYREDDPVGPIGVYGRSKLEGEQAVATANPDHAIVRTAWVYSPFGKNFIKTMLRLSEARDALRVVSDQHGSPTSAHDIAAGVLAIASNLLAHPDDDSMRGVFHMTGLGHTTWAGFAERVFAASRAMGRPGAAVEPISTQDYPTPARRPANSRLDCAKLRKIHKVELPHWGEAVDACVVRLLRSSSV